VINADRIPFYRRWFWSPEDGLGRPITALGLHSGGDVLGALDALGKDFKVANTARLAPSGAGSTGLMHSRNSLAVYRLAFGQARQEDVIDHLLRRLGPDELERSPPSFGST
jgi:hypothetical protein